MSEPFRVAIRAEGAMINAYLAKTSSMDEALLVASISRKMCEDSAPIFEAFKGLASVIASELVQMAGLTLANIEIRAAPEHERSGSG